MVVRRYKLINMHINAQALFMLVNLVAFNIYFWFFNREILDKWPLLKIALYVSWPMIIFGLVFSFYTPASYVHY